MFMIGLALFEMMSLRFLPVSTLISCSPLSGGRRVTRR
jgi:hypothetical protein